MDIKTELLREHSKAQTLHLVDYIGGDQGRFDELMELFFEGEQVEQQRAAWVFRYAGEAYPVLVKLHVKRLIENLYHPVHDAVKRNSLLILEREEVEEDLLGLLADRCFEWLADPKEAIAIRAISMEILYKVCLKEPDLANELKIIVEDAYPNGSAGFKNKARKVLKGLEKLTADY